MRGLVLLTILALLLSPSSSVGAEPESLTFAGCTQLFLSYPMSVAGAASYLPPGFEPVKFTTDPTGNTGSMSLYFNTCAPRTEGGAPFGETLFLIRTVAPAPWHDPSAATTFFIFAASVTDPDVAAAYAAWDLTTGAVGSSTLSTHVVQGDRYAVLVTAESAEVGITASSANGLPGPAWPVQHIRLFGAGPDGDLGAVDHTVLPGGRQSGIQAGSLTITHGIAPHDRNAAAIGRDFRWGSGVDSWRLTPVDLPPL